MYGVGKERGVARLVIVIAVVAQQIAYTVALCIERRHGERTAFLQLRDRGARGNELRYFGGEVEIGHRVERVKWANAHRIANLGFLRVLLCQHFVLHTPLKVSIIFQCVLRNRCAQGRVYPAHQHWGLAKGFAYPFACARCGLGKGVPYPETNGERGAIIAATQERTIRCAIQSSLHFFLCRGEMRVVFVVRILYFRKANVQLVAFGNALRGGTRSSDKRCDTS